ncbi:hypothetical protein [Nocardioides panacisoli]|uniref:VCBS repeat-containing protein n=1 Tax=Nocardioides panacisoli TaxID=627624 RepID=A0ABP7IBC5_9ACTN
MSDIETRLREALTARAELVRPEDLTRGVPEPEPRLPWWRHPGTYLVAAACVAVATVSAVALVVGSSDQADRKPGFTDSDSPSPTATAPVTIPDTWGTAPDPQPDKQWTGDVDGDGRPDRVSLTDGTTLEVTTANGTLTEPVDGGEVTVGGLLRLVGAARAVIAVQASQGAAGTVYTDWHLYGVRDGKLVELQAPGPPHLGNRESDVPGGTNPLQTWTTTGSGAGDEIYTLEYVDAGSRVERGTYPGDGTRLFHARFYHWVLHGASVRAEPLGVACVVPPSRAVFDCP